MIKGNGVITSPKHDRNRITVSLAGVRVTGVLGALVMEYEGVEPGHRSRRAGDG